MYDRVIISLCKDYKDQKVLILYPRIAENDVNVKELLSFDLATVATKKMYDAVKQWTKCIES